MNDPAQARWMQLEIYGHRVLVGLVSETTLAGEPMLKIDVPPTKACPEGFSQMFGGKAIFSASELDEKTARKMAEQKSAMPPRPWTNAHMLSPRHDDDEDDGYEQPMLPAGDDDSEEILEPLGVTDERHNRACWICGGAPVTINMSMVCAAKGPYCRGCVAASREPIGLLVGSMVGVAPEDIDGGMRLIIDATLVFYRYTEAEFWALVTAAAATRNEPPHEPSPPPAEGSADIPF